MVSKIFFRAHHRDVASTMVQGAYSASVSSSISSVAVTYWSYFLVARPDPACRRASLQRIGLDLVEPLLLLLLADVQKELQDDGAVVGQHALEIEDVAVGVPPCVSGISFSTRSTSTRLYQQ